MQDLTTFLYSASLLLPPAERQAWANGPSPAALLSELSGSIANEDIATALSAPRLVDAAGVFARLGVVLEPAAARVHLATASAIVPTMPNTLRSLLRSHYVALGLMGDAAQHPELARALGTAPKQGADVPIVDMEDVATSCAAASDATASAGGSSDVSSQETGVGGSPSNSGPSDQPAGSAKAKASSR